jgi:hypothetical protein
MDMKWIPEGWSWQRTSMPRNQCLLHTRRARFDASGLAKLVRPHVLSALSPQALKGVRSGFFSGPHDTQISFNNHA